MITSRRSLRAAEERAQRIAAEARAAVLEAALDLIPVGVVIQPLDAPRLRNSVAQAMAVSRTADVLADHVVDELLAGAADGAAVSRTIELQGPPRRVLAVSVRPIEGSDGARLGVAAVVEDTTERHQLDAVRRDFVANVSHELRTPIGALSVLADTIADHDDVQVIRRLAVRIGDESRRAVRLVEELLDLSRIEAAGSVAFGDVDPAEVVAEAVANVQSVADQRGTVIHVDGGRRQVIVRADRSQLLSAVTNLVDNAVKYAMTGGVVDVELVDEGRNLAIVVRDQGIGIPRRDLERVFERFYRVDRARSRETGGTGLGLAIVRHVAENHGGSVTVESTEGVGSIFTMRIPTSEEASP